MDESNDVQALEKISSEVDESQIKVILSTQCIKAQAFLVDKLRKQTERHKEVCSFISSANLKLEAEIKQAEQEIRSMLIAHDTIKTANVELKKEWLLAKEKKIDIIDRIEIGVKKYEAVWLQCKERFESIPFVQKLLRGTEKVQTLKYDIDGLEKQAHKLYEEIKTRRDVCVNLDKQRIIEVANFIVTELPNMTKIIQEKTAEIKDLSKQACDKNLTEVAEQNLNTIKLVKIIKNVDDDLSQLCRNGDSLIPKLELADFDFDSIDVNLDQVQLKKNELFNKTYITVDPIITSTDNRNLNQDDRADGFIISPYFHNPINDEKSQNYSKRKLINILEDIKIDNKEAYNIVSKVNPEKFQVVNEISAEGGHPKDKDNALLENEDIEVIDLTSSNKDIIIPPTQFLDISVQGSQESISKKRVSFDLRSTMCTTEMDENDDKPLEAETKEQYQTMTSQLDVSAGSDESFMKIKDMILKKHNLDLSPQFVYAKNSMLQKDDDDKVVTSKFFQHEQKLAVVENIQPNLDMEPEAISEKEKINLIDENNLLQSQKKVTEHIPMDVDDVIEASPKENKENEEVPIEKPVSGLLFTHGAQGIPDSLDVSISTTGFEDSDFPQCIDSSLLLSPKADVPMTGNNAEVLSQEVPNFLTGLRKTGFSFFGGGPSTSSKPDPSAQNQGNNFNFNFSGDDKKNRGGLFNMFH